LNQVRKPFYGREEQAKDALTPAQMLEVLQKMTLVREFDRNTVAAMDAKRIKVPTYLATGQEAVAATVSTLFKGCMVFGQHRNYSYYLCYGGDQGKFINEMLGLTTGTAQGMAGAPGVHDLSIPMYGHSGLMGDQIPIAVGAAHASGKRTLAIMGDASSEEDYVITSLAYAGFKRLEMLFVSEDNDLSILTPKSTRRNWETYEFARVAGLTSVDMADDPFAIAHHLQANLDQLPLFLNVRTCRHLWHSGYGVDGAPEWNRYELFLEELFARGLQAEAEEIRQRTTNEVNELWRRHLEN